MNSFIKTGIVLGFVSLLFACQDKSSPNYQYMPNMYEPIGYETYGKIGFLPNGMEAQELPANTIPRGWMPYAFENTAEGKELAGLQSSPLDSLQKEVNLAKGAELYKIYCATCHGSNGKGQGDLVKREKILGVPGYDDVARNVTVGTTFHTIQHGLNSMGSYTSQMNTEEMWQVSEYVMKLKKDLIK